MNKATVLQQGWGKSEFNGYWRQAWSDLARAHRNANPFHTPEMFEALAGCSGCQPAVLLAVHGDIALAAVMPVRISLTRWPLGRLGRRVVVYGGILAEESENGLGAVFLLLHHLKKAARGIEVEVRGIREDGIAARLIEQRFRAHPFVNFSLSLHGGENGVWKRISRNGRKTIRNALNKPVNVIRACDREVLLHIYSLLVQTYRRERVPLPSLSLFESALESLGATGTMQLFLARQGENPIAGSVELAHGETLYGWYQGYNVEFAGYRPNDLLMWHVLQWACRSGFKWYDFGGAGQPHQPYGVRDFKAKFGGRLVEDTRYRLALVPGVRPAGEILWKGSRVLRRLLAS